MWMNHPGWVVHKRAVSVQLRNSPVRRCKHPAPKGYRVVHPSACAIRIAGVQPANVYTDTGVSGSTETRNRSGWNKLDEWLQTTGDTLRLLPP